jgi:hypothetical protein
MCDAMHDDIYTDTQKLYVAGLPDDVSELKQHLLYQIRLRDNMERDRNAFERQNNELIESVIDARSIIKQFRDAHPDTPVVAAKNTKFTRELNR